MDKFRKNLYAIIILAVIIIVFAAFIYLFFKHPFFWIAVIVGLRLIKIILDKF